MTRVSVRERLRQETVEHHRWIEDAVALLGPGLSRERYRRTLRMFHGFHAPLETALVTALPLAPPLRVPFMRRSALLAQDLASLGLSPGALATLPRCRHLPATTTGDEVAGCLYVLEGASLGGQVIAREVASRLSAGTGAAFFFGVGEGTGRRWKRILEWLDDTAALGRPDRIVGAAKDTFRCLGRWIKEPRT
jgi:heme oxygenase (biliverdin-IX-beta and delta-forming)